MLTSLYQLEIDMFLWLKSLNYISKYYSIFKHVITEYIFVCYNYQMHAPDT